jgi:colicin import membrane protein
MDKEVEYKGNSYGLADLKGMTAEDLLVLRNEIAADLNVAAVKSFKDHDAAVEQTSKALIRYSEQNPDAPAEAKAVKEKKPKAEPKERGLAKSAEAKTVKRPTRKMFSTISKTGEHAAEHGRAHRWPNYTDGMTIADVIETEGTEPWDVYNWEKAGIMKVTEPTDEEFAARKAAWYTKHNLTDPEVAKAAKAVEKKAAAEAKAAAKAEKDAADKAAADAKATAQAEAEAATQS